MSDNKRYYYIKLKDNFFDQDNIKILKNMRNGHTYLLIIIELYLKACKNNGRLMMTPAIPYTPDNLEILADVINHDVAHIREAIQAAEKLDLIKILDSGEMWMTEIQNYIGKSSNEADRIRKYRMLLNETKKSVQMYTKEREKDRSRDRDKEKERMDDLNRPYLPLAELLYNEHLKYDPCFLGGQNLKKTFNRWANDIRLLVEKDRKQDENAIETVRNVIIWCQSWEGNGNFSWRPNILSGKKLREKFPTLYSQYIQNNNKYERPKKEYEKRWEKKYKHRLKELEL